MVSIRGYSEKIVPQKLILMISGLGYSKFTYSKFKIKSIVLF